MESQQTNRRIKTAGYRKAIVRLAIRNSYREATDIFNQNYHRLNTDDKLSYATLAGDIEQEGTILLQLKQQMTHSILTRHGFDSVTGKHPGEILPVDYCNFSCEWIIIDPVQFMNGVVPGWSDDHENLSPDADAEEELKGDSESQPDTEEFHTVMKRRGKRIEVDPEKKEDICIRFAQWFNSVAKRSYYGIIHPWKMEKDSSEVLYISIDAVYVDKQTKHRKTNSNQTSQKGNPVSTEIEKQGPREEKDKRIGHMNIKIEADGQSYYITSTDTNESFRELVAFFLNNHLFNKYMIFMTDGELAIHDKIEEYFGKWNHHFELDWIHLERKCYDRLSNALRGKRVPDPRGETEYYKKGPKKGQIKSQDHTSESRLYARALSRILWAGNVDEAIQFLDHISSKVVRNPSELNQLKTYLENKKEWIPCYALRKKAGLKNSSNGVEGQNQMNVADRQKHNGTSWRPEGSSYLSSLTTMFNNKEDDEWFSNGTLRFGFKE
jgi:hypothetical protein